MTGTLTERAYAKINLALHVRHRRPDGYHDIETLFAFCEDGDFLGVGESDDLLLEAHGPFADGLSTGPDNLVMRAAAALRDYAGVKAGARLTLFKNLPVASGIGGGSADAAAALRILWHFWHLRLNEDQLREVAGQLGADVPACVGSRPVFGHGKGDVLDPVATGLEGVPVLLVNPRVAVSTAAVFAAWDGRDHGPLDPGDPSSWRNDLTAAAISIAPAIQSVIERLAERKGATLARMSGSGATCFALFGDEASRDAAAAAFPDCWTLATRLRSR